MDGYWNLLTSKERKSLKISIAELKASTNSMNGLMCFKSQSILQNKTIIEVRF